MNLDRPILHQLGLGALVEKLFTHHWYSLLSLGGGFVFNFTTVNTPNLNDKFRAFHHMKTRERIATNVIPRFLDFSDAAYPNTVIGDSFCGDYGNSLNH
jgi:hypothetical protein